MRLIEHSIIETVKVVQEGSTIVPIGSKGTIVHVHQRGYEVEFENPLEVIYCQEDSIRKKAV